MSGVYPFLCVDVLTVEVRNVYSVYVMSMAQLLDWLVVMVKVAKEYNPTSGLGPHSL